MEVQQTLGSSLFGPVGGLAEELSRTDVCCNAWHEESAEDARRLEWPLFLGELDPWEGDEDSKEEEADHDGAGGSETAGLFGAALKHLLEAKVVEPAHMRCCTCNTDRPFGTFGFHLQKKSPAHLRYRICDGTGLWGAQAMHGGVQFPHLLTMTTRSLRSVVPTRCPGVHRRPPLPGQYQ